MPCQTKCLVSFASRGNEKKKGGRSRPCFWRNCKNCSGVACSPNTAIAGSPGTNSISKVTSETTVQTTSRRISIRRRGPRILYRKVDRTLASSQLLTRWHLEDEE